MISTSVRSDFADWLSPMLVKELRQGMRSRVFMAAFYFTQLLMILSAVFNLAATSEGTDSNGALDFLNGLFWFLIAVPLVFIMPIRGFGALHSELKARTLELVFLTRLSAWRIAAGKWIALVVQTLLLICAVLPYVLLRYFLGGVNIIEDLQALFFLLLISCTLTAVTVAMSAYESGLLRALFIIGLIFSLFWFVGILTAVLVSGRMGAGGSPVAPLPFYLSIVVFLPAFLLLTIEMAASRIAPPAENHAVRKRLIGLYLLVVAPQLIALIPGGNTEFAFPLSLVFLIAVIVDALAEPLYNLVSPYRPFFRRGALGRGLSVFFVPGWPSAAWFVFLLAIVGGFTLLLHGRLSDPREILFYVSYLGWLIFPAACLRLFAPHTKHFLGFYLALHFFLATVTLLASMVAGITDQSRYWLSVIPNCTFILNRQLNEEELPVFLLVTLVMTAASLLILLIRSLIPLRDIYRTLRQSSVENA